MGRLAKLLGLVMVATGAAVVTAVVLEDQEVREKVVEAVATVKNTAREVAEAIADGIEKAKGDSGMTPTEKNQAWTEEQWEALGI